jgi:hypothetical protein
VLVPELDSSSLLEEGSLGDSGDSTVSESVDSSNVCELEISEVQSLGKEGSLHGNK